MKLVLTAATILGLAYSALALDGNPRIHDPSTVMLCDGKYYVFGTGNGGLVSSDGWTWTSGAPRPGGGVAADLIHIGDRYYMAYATSQGQPKSDQHIMWTKSLDTNSPNYKWEDIGVVASSDGEEECNAIDSGLFLDPVTEKLWLTYGSYYGFIRIVQLDPKTGKRIEPVDKPVDLAINCEASDMIYENGYYYLLVTHGSCCRGTDSGYNIRVGRSKSPTGPFVDHQGIDMIEGGGKLVIGSGGRFVGPGHFGRTVICEGVQKMSMHWEADMDRGGASVLDIVPLLWKDGWPVAGENMKNGTYQIESFRTGTALELMTEGVPVGQTAGTRRSGAPAGAGGIGAAPGSRRGGLGGTNAFAAFGGTNAPGVTNAPARRGGTRAARGGGGGMFGGSGVPIAAQEVSQVSSNWAKGDINIRMGNYMCQAQQKWTITALTNAGGYLGAPYFKITIAGTDRALAATSDGELTSVADFTGAPEQCWRFDQLTDGTWRIMPKAIPGIKEEMALSAIGASSVTLSKFDPNALKHRWLIKAP